MINLRGIANGIINAINPDTPAILKVNEGYDTSASGTQIPKFVEQPIMIQLQSIETAALEHLNLVSQQGQFSYAYADGRISALRRSLGKGNEQLVFTPYGEDEAVTWKVIKVIESYPSWVKVLICRQ